MADSADLYRTVRLIRRFEQRAIELVRSGVIPGGIHPYIGEEAIAAGVCAALRADDLITSTHRGHGHVLAKGADPIRMLAELAGRETGLNGGRGGSMHAADVSAGIYGANAIVGASAAIAAGAAWSHRRAGHDRVAVTFFGDGAVNQGVLLEALNLASLRRLPVIFVCENNQFATSMRVQDTTSGTITGRAEAFGIPAETIDGMDPEAVLEAASGAVDPRQGRRRPDVPGVPDLPVRRPPHLGVQRPPALPHGRGGRRGQRPRPAGDPGGARARGGARADRR